MMIFTYFISCFPHDLCVAWQSLDFDHMSRYLLKLRNNKSMMTDKLDSSILLGVWFNCQERVTKKEFLKSSEPYDLLRNIQVAELSHELDRILDKMNRKFRLPCTFFIYWWWKALSYNILWRANNFYSRWKASNYIFSKLERLKNCKNKQYEKGVIEGNNKG